jgi:hypothetical protein
MVRPCWSGDSGSAPSGDLHARADGPCRTPQEPHPPGARHAMSPSGALSTRWANRRRSDQTVQQRAWLSHRRLPSSWGIRRSPAYLIGQEKLDACDAPRAALKLAHHARLVVLVPMLGHLSVPDPEDADLADRVASSPRWQTHELPDLRRPDGHPDSNAIPLRDHGLDRETHVGEDGRQAVDRPFEVSLSVVDRALQVRDEVVRQRESRRATRSGLDETR